MTRGVSVVVMMVALSALAQERQRPSVALLPLELPAKMSGDQKELDAAWYGLVARKQKVDLALPDEVRGEYQRKFKGSCPDNELYECLAWLAEHSSSTYAVLVKARKLGPKEWELVASIGAKNKAPVAQPVVHRFTVADAKGLKDALKKQLEEYLGRMDLQGLPLDPGAQVKVVEVVKPVEPQVKVMPVEPVKKEPVKVEQPVKAEEPKKDGTMRVLGLSGAVIGGMGVVGGGALFLSTLEAAKGIDSRRDTATGFIHPGDAGSYVQVRGRQNIGVGLMVGGAVLAAAGAAMMVLSPSDVVIVAAPTQGGAMASVGGTF